MDPRTVITSRIDLHLRRELGEGIDTHRALHDSRYARDVLLVCDAMPDTDLPQLAEEFRAATQKVRRADPPMPQPSFAARAQRSLHFARTR